MGPRTLSSAVAMRVTRGRPLSPWGDPIGQTRILDRPLAEVQEAALAAAGVRLVEAPPAVGPYLIFSDRTWFTPELVRMVLAGGPGRLRVDAPGWWAATGALQRCPQPGVYEFGLHPGGQGPLEGLEPVVVDLGLKKMDPITVHPALAHASRELWSGPAMIHQLDHWSHLARISQLALIGRFEEGRLEFERAPLLRRLWLGLKILLRARSIRQDRILTALVERGPGVQIHPTAVVEASVLGEGAKVGAFAVVRGSVLGAGAEVGEHALVQMSVLGERSKVGPLTMANFCTLYPGAELSGYAYQLAVLGRDAFVAWGTALLDLSFGRTIPVWMDGERVDSGQHFLGVAVGHRAVLGNAVRISYGVEVPNGATVVAPPEGLIRSFEGVDPEGGVLTAREGRAAPVGRLIGAGNPTQTENFTTEDAEGAEGDVASLGLSPRGSSD